METEIHVFVWFYTPIFFYLHSRRTYMNLSLLYIECLVWQQDWHYVAPCGEVRSALSCRCRVFDISHKLVIVGGQVTRVAAGDLSLIHI